MRLAAAATLALLAAAGAIGLGGTAPFGRLALRAGLPSAAAPLLDDPYWKGVALYRMARFEESAEAFRAAGQAAFYNRGNALARAGRYAEAVAFYDAVLFYAPHDENARANRALVDALIEHPEAERAARGRLDAEGSVADADDAGGTKQRGVDAAEQQQVTPVFSGQSVAASRQWLATLADEPGRYLKLRIAAEHERRHRLGTAMVVGDDPW